MPRAKKNDTGVGEASFQFVTTFASPTAAKNRAETRALVRANATKYQWKYSRSSSQPRSAAVTRLEDAKGSRSGGVRQETTSSSSGAGSPQPHRPAKPQYSPSLEVLNPQYSSPAARESSEWHESDDSVSTDVNDEEDVALVDEISSQSLILGQGIQLRRPFPTSFTPNHMDRLVDFNFEIIIPALLPTVDGGREHPATKEWVQRGLNARTLFLLWMHGGAVDTRIPQGAREALGSIAIRRNYVQILQQLNEDMKDPEKACQDENILAVSGMTSYPIDGPILKHVSLPNQAGMKSLQGLNLHSTFRSVPEHARGLEMLVNMRGGIGNLTMEGLGAIISYYWTFQATRELIIPRVPFVSLLSGPSSATTDVNLPPHDHPLGALGTGFLVYWRSTTSQLIHDLVAVIRLICHYTMIIDDHCEGRFLQTNLAKLADQRNMTQHKTMSLPPLLRGTADPWSDDLYEAARLATIIYSVIVVFPISPVSAPFGELARRVTLELSHVDVDKVPARADHILLWILIMGGIAAIYQPERQWYVSVLARFSVQRDLNVWDDLREILSSFLWLPNISDGDGLALWREVTQHLQSNSTQNGRKLNE